MQSIFFLLGSVWGVVAFALIVRYALQYKRVKNTIRLCGRPADERVKKMLRRISAESRKTLTVHVLYCDLLMSPAGFGIFEKIILLPDDIYSESELYFILRHEYTHFMNRDLFLKAAMHIVSCIFWWHPLFLFLEKRLSLKMEFRCDADVVNGMGREDKIAYLKTLIHILEKDCEIGQTDVLCEKKPFLSGRRNGRANDAAMVARFRQMCGESAPKRKKASFCKILSKPLDFSIQM